MKVLEWFNDNYAELVEEMKLCSHNLSSTELSPYHAEGTIWTHTMMVYSQLLPDASNELKLAALLHDIGKPYCAIIREDKGRVSFTGHEHYTSFKAIDVLNKFEDTAEPINKENILYAINYHDLFHKGVKSENDIPFIPEDFKQKLNIMFDTKLDLFELLFDLSYADMKGRISKDMALSISKYELLRNYVPYRGTQLYNKKELKAHFIIGLPGSGKSTKAEELLKEDSSLIYISIDDEIMNLNKYSFTYNGAWSKDRQKEATAIVLTKLKECVDKKQSFIIDAVNGSTKIRQRRLNHIPNSYEKIAHVMLAGDDFISNVMKERKDKHIPMENVYGMSKDFLYPSLFEFDIIDTTILKK